MAFRYFLNTGNSDWQVGANWSATNGGATVNAIPTASDDVFLTSLSGDCLVNVNSNANSLNCTGYTRTLTLDGNFILITSGGSIVLNSVMTISSNTLLAQLRVNTASITCNGATIPVLGTTATGTITLLDLLRVNILRQQSTSTPTFAGSFGFIIAQYQSVTNAGNVISLVPSITYKIDKFTWNTEKGTLHGRVQSSDTTTHVKTKLTVTGDISLANIDFTDVDASGGRALYTFNGVVTNSININSMTDVLVQKAMSSSFIT
jgi:hypothetical protein